MRCILSRVQHHNVGSLLLGKVQFLHGILERGHLEPDAVGGVGDGLCVLPLGHQGIHLGDRVPDGGAEHGLIC